MPPVSSAPSGSVHKRRSSSTSKPRPVSTVATRAVSFLFSLQQPNITHANIPRLVQRVPGEYPYQTIQTYESLLTTKFHVETKRKSKYTSQIKPPPPPVRRFFHFYIAQSTTRRLKSLHRQNQRTVLLSPFNDYAKFKTNTFVGSPSEHLSDTSANDVISQPRDRTCSF